MAETPHVDVYAAFPKSLVPDSGHYLDVCNWIWVHSLSIPHSEFSGRHFIQHPYKWIRYAIGVIIGAQGLLSTTQDTFTAVTETEDLPPYTFSLYYFVDNEEKARMFPLDPRMGRTSITSSVSTSQRAHFQDEVAARDGGCVLTGQAAKYCETVHLIPYNKGDEYISSFTLNRSRDPNRDDVINDINDIRNGLMLNGTSHHVIGIDVAILRTPNFAMDSTDVDPNVIPTAILYTSHRFTSPRGDTLEDVSLPTGSRIRLADANLPPPILFDAVYAGAVFHHYGVRNATDLVNGVWGNSFYLGAVTSARQAESKASKDSKAAVSQKEADQADARLERYQGRSAQREGVPDTFDVLSALPYILLPPGELQSVMRDAEMRASQEEKKRVQEKVDEWRRRA